MTSNTRFGPLPATSTGLYAPQKNSWMFTLSEITRAPSLVPRATRPLEPFEELWGRHMACMFLDKVGGKQTYIGKDKLVHHPLAITSSSLNKAKILLHRFYMVERFQEFHWQPLCAALLSMASKLHEAVSFRTLPDVAAKCAKACFDERHFGFGFPAQLAAFEQEIRAVEVKLAKALFGDFNPDEPSHYVKDIIKEYNGSDQLRDRAFKACADACITTLGIRLPAKTIANVAVNLACFKTRERLTRNGRDWWRERGLDVEELRAYSSEIDNATNEMKTRELIQEKMNPKPKGMVNNPLPSPKPSPSGQKTTGTPEVASTAGTKRKMRDEETEPLRSDGKPPLVKRTKLREEVRQLAPKAESGIKPRMVAPEGRALKRKRGDDDDGLPNAKK